MAKREDFDREFDNETEYDFDPNEMFDDASESADDEFDFLSGLSETDDDLDSILTDDFLASLGIERSLDETQEEEQLPQEEPALMEEPDYEEDSLPEEAEEFLEEIEEFLDEAEEFLEDEVLPEEEPEEDDVQLLFRMDEEAREFQETPVPAFDVEPELGEEFTKAFEEDFPTADPDAENEQTAVPVVEVTEEEAQPEKKAPTRRRKLSRERLIKEVYLPPAILALTLVLLLTFIGTSIGRAVKNKQDEKEALAASQQAASDALSNEATMLVVQADKLAKGYDYDAAIALLDTFSGDKSEHQILLDAYNSYNQAKSQVVPIDEPASIPNLSFHCLIADPTRAFTDKEFGKAYNTNYVTIDEFSKILEQLYANGYVLVDFDSFIVETVGEDGKITYSTHPIYLPAGKKPIMLTETLVNYEIFTVDSDGDLEADQGGDGFASKLVVDANGNIVNEMVDVNGNTVYGAYDMVPILENFIKSHPDFSYRGARATLAVSGEDGVFGYRIMHSVKESKGEDYYNAQVEGAKQIAAALREAGYTIACYTYANVSYGQLSATKIQVDLDNWKKEVTPVLGDVPVLVYAKSSDISADGNYQGGKYNVLNAAGFRYFVSSATVPYAEVTVNYVRQSRIMVTGQAMTTSPQTFSSYFTVSEILNDLRGS